MRTLYDRRSHPERSEYCSHSCTSETLSLRRKDSHFPSEILQTSSEISGQLPDGWQNELGTLLFKLLPAGSISGAPKAATQKLIRQAEGLPRGYYSGVFGYFDGQPLDSDVLIRFIEKVDNRYYFRSGGGITVNSQAKEEYQEILEKIYLPIQK